MSMVTTMENKPLFSIREAATYLGISYKTAYRMVKDHRIASQRVGLQWRIPREALLKDIDGKKAEKK